ncbi:MAG: serine--tRNA ligase [Candidatus Doudnabacteria bacterium RIFCSPLOWO2_02_FULL_48_8]|uniref:Serine--tRNA ligase n=1 Tax=Candidatus Doudnabacteria bacterium RIFCSPHIGHO2_01_FULL_46_24 TaxID=1817825 RepID=A0A1F5NUR2_9BACT|nr:MAG: serine--tRNA ligase [Candidatus Doudnabacteria bacterium RIFCSPHIGHO2_01_FULL_46_24]OGE94241.1 MAG: serine--tRNA ligase [Candidatus Doudnabacteria bacterium RIFCSPHIGHO2_12_FULL_48_11]OGE94992.1 MAG: serine--tRNA ligase [Candidatus Doudnabacteria bacterium RIFCSPLOWO2_02_FULL_48_8]
MLDIKFIRENQEVVRKAIKDKGTNLEALDEVLSLDDTRRKLIIETEALRSRRNEITKNLKKGKDDSLVDESRKIKDKLSKLELELKEVEDRWLLAMYEIPNIPWKDVPVGADETENQIVAEWGKPKKFKFKPKDHLELGEALDVVDMKRGSKVAGSRFGYWKGGMAILELALIQFVLRTLTSEQTLKKIADTVEKGYPAKPFIPIIPPVMIKSDIYRKTARLSDADKNERYYLPDDDLYLIGSAEHTLVSMHADEALDQKNLPLRYVGISTCFRREAGSYGKDVKGMIRLHQFDKVEMESFVTAENSFKEHQFFVAIEEYLLQVLEIPYQKLLKCTADIGNPNARGVDLNCWLPGQALYRETHTADMMTDYQARRLNIKIRKPDGATELLHTNDATAITMRAAIAIMENYQQADGSILVPKALQEFTGFDVIQ